MFAKYLCSFVKSKTRMNPMAFLKKEVVKLRYLSCPAVSHSCSLTRWPLPPSKGWKTRRRSRKSTPTVVTYLNKQNSPNKHNLMLKHFLFIYKIYIQKYFDTLTSTIHVKIALVVALHGLFDLYGQH
jgi:hypothetical protein